MVFRRKRPNLLDVRRRSSVRLRKFVAGEIFALARQLRAQLCGGREFARLRTSPQQHAHFNMLLRIGRPHVLPAWESGAFAAFQFPPVLACRHESLRYDSRNLKIGTPSRPGKKSIADSRQSGLRPVQEVLTY